MLTRWIRSARPTMYSILLVYIVTVVTEWVTVVRLDCNGGIHCWAAGPLGTIIRTSKRLHMRLHYTLMDNRVCYFTFKTVNFSSMEEDRGVCVCVCVCVY